MRLLERVRRPRPAEVEENPWEAGGSTPQVAVVANPWKPERRQLTLRSSVAPAVTVDVWRPPKMAGYGLKYRVLHSASAALILLNIVVGLFFYSSNMTLNAALLGYLGVSTVLLGHYFALTRG